MLRMSGFKKFLVRGNLVDLAVAVVVGAAFGAMVTGLVSDFVTPLIAAIGGSPHFQNLSFTINKSHFNYGHFINVALTFLIIAAVVYFLVVMPVGRLLDHLNRNAEATTRECPECLSDIPIRARRCAHCTAQVTPAVQQP